MDVLFYNHQNINLFGSNYNHNMETNQPLLSVIIPVYNVEKYLKECIDSVINQTLHDIEIILVDDKSPDNCASICDEYAYKDSRVKVIHKTQNEGLGHARNSGLSLATGEYVTFIDSDDYIDLDAYKSLYSVAKRNNLDVLRFNCNRFSKKNEFSNISYTNSLIIYDNREDIEFLIFGIFDKCNNKGKNYFLGGSSCMAIYKRDIIQKNNISFVSEREYISEDLIFNIDVYHKIKKFGYVDNTYYHYRLNINSITNKVEYNKIKRIEKYCIYVDNYISNLGIKKSSEIYIMGYYLSGARVCIKQIFLSNLPLEKKKKWFYENFSTEYSIRVSKKYPGKKLNLFRYLSFLSIKYQSFFMCYLLVLFYYKLKVKKV